MKKLHCECRLRERSLCGSHSLCEAVDAFNILDRFTFDRLVQRAPKAACSRCARALAKLNALAKARAVRYARPNGYRRIYYKRRRGNV